MTRTVLHRSLRGHGGLTGVLATLVLASVLGCSGSPTDDGTDGGTVKPPPAPYPGPRGFTQLVFHPPTRRVFMFGGESNQRTTFEDAWTYDVASNKWLEITGAPHPVRAGGGAAAYDAESGRIIVHYTTRLDASGPNGLNRISETWAFNPDAGTWTDMHPDPAPFGLMGARMVYDAAADRMILFGGADFTQASSPPYFNDTWAYDFNTNSWSQRHPDQSPPGRSYYGMVYDGRAARVLIYGGSFASTDPGAVDELWAYDHASDHWEQIAYTGDAPPDHHPAMAYAGNLDRTFYMVGQSFYAFDYNAKAWTQLAYDPAMGNRHFHGMTFDDTSGKLVVFGGGPAGLQYDDQTWTYDPSSNRWQRALRQ